MTEVSKMTDAELAHHIWYFTSWPGRLPGSVPKYCTDPAASLEVQAAAIAKDARWYKYRLAVVTSGFDRIKYHAPLAIYGPDMVDLMLTATPRQRAEAAYMTLKVD